MSFSLRVKDELAKVMPGARHCQIAELAAIIGMCGRIYTTPKGKHFFRVSSENRNVVYKCQVLIKKAFGYESDATVRYNIDTKNRIYIMSVMNSDMAIKILLAAKIMNTDGSINRDMSLVNTVVIQNMCCKRAFLRGAFLAGGSISDPEKSYHFEITASGEAKAKQILDAVNVFELDGRIVQRRRYYVVYLKEGAHIVDMLNVMGAHVSLMDLENVRILKEVRNSINRQVNCETANMGKTIQAAVKQIEDINYIRDKVGLDSLNESLEEIAVLRLQYPDISLKDLGEKLSPPVGKSGVNHRLRKISRIADEIRNDKKV
ncbi:MAG: DNA-binding protein WhiA [Butyrivibrio sp.]